MPKFRARSEVEAVRWNGKEIENPPQWLTMAVLGTPGTPNTIFRFGSTIHVHNIEGQRYSCIPGDWIVWDGKSVRGVDDFTFTGLFGEA
jgi:hypothetical protein